LDSVIKCPVAFTNHDVWVDTSQYDRIYVATKNDDRNSFLSVDKDGWFFIPAWTLKENAEKYIESHDLVGVHEIINISVTELCLLARAVMINGVPMLVSGTNIAENILSSYAPTPTIYSCITSMWHYAEISGEKVRTENGELYVQLSASVLMAKLYNDKPELFQAIIDDELEVKTMMFKQLVQQEEYVYTDGELLNVKKGLETSKVLRKEIEDNNV
jgi:hypothetical protein